MTTPSNITYLEYNSIHAYLEVSSIESNETNRPILIRLPLRSLYSLPAPGVAGGESVELALRPTPDDAGSQHREEDWMALLHHQPAVSLFRVGGRHGGGRTGGGIADRGMDWVREGARRQWRTLHLNPMLPPELGNPTKVSSVLRLLKGGHRSQ